MANVRFADKVREQISDAGKYSFSVYKNVQQTNVPIPNNISQHLVSKGANSLIDTGKLFTADKVKKLQLTFKNRTQQKTNWY